MYLFTKMGFSILVSDVDTVWMRNPLPYMAQYSEADILTSSDHLVKLPNPDRNPDLDPYLNADTREATRGAFCPCWASPCCHAGHLD